MSNINIVIPRQFYVNKRESGLGFATYYEDNAAFLKRKGTIDAWAGSGRVGEVLDNTARSGITITRNVIHGGGWNDINILWRVSDPLGFELEISSGNLAKLMNFASIERGAIIQECVWGWDKTRGSKPVLIPITSDLYEQAYASTRLHNSSRIPMRDIKPGNWVRLKSGETVMFLGTYYTLEKENKYSTSTHGYVKKRRSFVLIESTQFRGRYLQSYASLNVVEVLNDNTITFEQAKALLPNTIISLTELPDVRLEFVQITEAEVKELFADKDNRSDIFKAKTGVFYRISNKPDGYYTNSRSEFTINSEGKLVVKTNSFAYWQVDYENKIDTLNPEWYQLKLLVGEEQHSVSMYY